MFMPCFQRLAKQMSQTPKRRLARAAFDPDRDSLEAFGAATFC